ncbi:MAG: rod shape-determining protein RodA [Sphingobacteriales bacterium]|nr:MAG: rod shape-determining protein RodA [Sphingobacteriales bacterium]
MSSQSTNIDWVLVFTYLLLVTIGWLAIYTADYKEQHPEIYYLGSNYGKQLLWIGVALLVGLCIQILDSRFYTAFAYPIYALSLLSLLVVLLIGTNISGSKSWIKLGFFNVQPAEFAKFATCLALAKYISSLSSVYYSLKERLAGIAIVFIPIVLIRLELETGTALVFTSLAYVLYREGLLSGGILLLGVLAITLFVVSLLFPYFYTMIGVAVLLFVVLLFKGKAPVWQKALVFVPVSMLTLLAAGYLNEITLLVILPIVLSVFVFIALYFQRASYLILALFFACFIYVKGVDYIYHHILQKHQQNRIGVLLGTIEDKQGAGYNVNQSKIAIGSGGLYGKGYLEGTQNKGNFVPELSTDFIFCTIGEEFGFAGSAALIGIFVFFLLRIISLAERQRSRFSRVYAYGVACILFFHFTINIGMTIGLMPVIGIPLPFISYGGSGLLGFSILFFTLIKLDSERYMYLR